MKSKLLKNFINRLDMNVRIFFTKVTTVLTQLDAPVIAINLVNIINLLKET